MDRKFILIAEDDKFYQNVYNFKFAKDGHEVKVVGNGQLLLEEAKQHRPDLILLDVIMPVMDGFSTLKALKEDPQLKDIKTIVLSSLGQDEDREKAKSLGADDFMVKTNVGINELSAQISKILA